ncbi:hypothetical protein AB0I28_02605 [Phytomonospora sp. NPDC050363]|uniref:hypothetical protein n=1 Tax=Phytomonospora sp. NPDC050363 TaxID=3155642 RepID=UPI00340F81B4
MKKLIPWAALAFVVFFIAYRPSEAASIVSTILSGIGDVGQGFGDFVSSLFD